MRSRVIFSDLTASAQRLVMGVKLPGQRSILGRSNHTLPFLLETHCLAASLKAARWDQRTSKFPRWVTHLKMETMCVAQVT